MKSEMSMGSVTPKVKDIRVIVKQKVRDAT